MTQPTTLETMTVHEIGARMAQLRGQFNLTPQEVSERLHIRTRYVHAMEEGRLDLLPGKVYARGYVQTYAEFLGLDAALVLARCFAQEDVSPAETVAPARAPMMAPQALVARHWRGYGVLGVIALLLMLFISQISGHSQEPDVEESIVAPVPEALLQSMRNLMMPTAANYTCLTEDALLECFYADNMTRMLAHVNDSERLLLMGNIDVASLAVPPAAVAASEEVLPETKAPAADEEVAAPAPTKSKEAKAEAEKPAPEKKVTAKKIPAKAAAAPNKKTDVSAPEKAAAKEASADKPAEDDDAQDDPND